MRGKLSHPAVNIASFLNFLFFGFFLSAVLSGCATPASEAIKRGDDMLNIKNYYDGSREYLAALNFEPKNNEAKAKLCQIAKQGYEQKLEMAVSYEKAANFEAALSQFQDLSTFIDQVTSNNCLSFAAVNAKQKGVNRVRS